MRKVSFKILYEVFFKSALLNNAINDAFSKINNDVDKSFIKKETTGVIENLDSIDKIINNYSKVKTDKLDRDILVILRLGIYELLYLDKVPAYAAINEYVEIVKKSKNSKLSGYVNAILRNVERKEKHIENAIDDAKNCYFRLYGGKDKKVLEELDKKNIFYKKYDGALDFKYAKVYSVDRYKEIIDTDSFKAGLIHIEDASSIYLTDKLAEILLVGEKINYKILDTCSSPGGKILGLIDLLRENKNANIEALARDISDEKLIKIKENIKRLLYSSITDMLKEKDTDNIVLSSEDKIPIKINTELRDATDLNIDDIKGYDLVICDVPCTGLGVIDKKPDIKLTFSEDKMRSLVEIQRKILDVSKDYVKENGYLSYSTCTETKEENEENIKYFLDKNKDYKLIFEKRIERKDENKADGFYMAIMKYEH